MISEVAVVVPARDEEASIGDTLRSILASLDVVGAAGLDAADTVVVVACDSCTDATADRARDVLGRRGVVIEDHWGSVGRARAAGAAAALATLAPRHPERCWLANTDADTTVPPDWLSLQLALADEGWAAALGIVRLAPTTLAGDDLARRFEDSYLSTVDGQHPHVHGANFGVHAQAYLAVGGWPHLAVSEDHALADRLAQGGWSIATAAHLVVTTSDRLVGRAPGGFADDLQALVDCA